MYKEEIEEQITRCKELQSNCRIDDIEAFIQLSKRIEGLAMLLDQFERQEVELKSYNSAKSEDKPAEYF